MQSIHLLNTRNYHLLIISVIFTYFLSSINKAGPLKQLFHKRGTSNSCNSPYFRAIFRRGIPSPLGLSAIVLTTYEFLPLLTSIFRKYNVLQASETTSKSLIAFHANQKTVYLVLPKYYTNSPSPYSVVVCPKNTPWFPITRNCSSSQQ